MPKEIDGINYFTQEEIDDKAKEVQTTIEEKLKLDFEKEKGAIAKSERERAKRDFDKSLMTEKEKIEQTQKEDYEALKAENEKYKLEKKQYRIKDALTKENLPDLFINDIRLQSATDENFDEVIKSVKDDWTKLTVNQLKGTAPATKPDVEKLNSAKVTLDEVVQHSWNKKNHTIR